MLLFKPAARLFWLVMIISIAASSCSVSKQIGKQADVLIKDSSLVNGRVGICIFDPATGKYLYDHDERKYFIPASNTKIFTCYAAMKYLGDSIPALTYYDFDTAIYVNGTGDPTFLHPDFADQPALDFLKRQRKIYINTDNWKDEAWGNGWAWNDYNDDYMAERSPLPVYGNVIRVPAPDFRLNGIYAHMRWNTIPAYFRDSIPPVYELPLSIMARREMRDSLRRREYMDKFTIRRQLHDNRFELLTSASKFTAAEIPFYTATAKTAINILQHDHHLPVFISNGMSFDESFRPDIPKETIAHTVYSRRTDSMLKPMMHRSDNFFAEQSLLMISNRLLDYMNDADITDKILKTDFAGMPQKPRWVDGSGLSRYNLFTPQSIVWVLNKIQKEFSMPRIKEIFATGGEGTISNYYLGLKGNIFAKTGTLSNHCAFSGFLITKKGRLLIFSVLTGSYPGGATPVRRAVEKFITGIYEKY